MTDARIRKNSTMRGEGFTIFYAATYLEISCLS